MKTRFKIIIVSIVGLAAFFTHSLVNELSVKSEDPIKAQVASLSAAEQSFHSAQGRYSDNPTEMGFRLPSHLQSSVYFHIVDIPIDIRVSMLEDDIPFVEKDRFKAILTFRCGTPLLCIARVDEHGFRLVRD